VFDALAASASRLCEAFDSAIWRREADRLLLVAHHGAIPQTGSESFLPLVLGTVGGRSVLDGRTIHIADIQTEAGEFPETSKNARRQGWRSILSVPLIREGVAIGAIVLRGTGARLFSERQVALLQTFADQAVIAIENVRLFNETKEALERETATGDILRLISSSPTDVQPVFDAIGDSAVRLCDAAFSGVFRFDGELIHLTAHAGLTAEELEAARRLFPIRAGTGMTGLSRVILDRTVVHIGDIRTDVEWQMLPGRSRSLDQLTGYRTFLAVPLRRDDVCLRAIN